MSLLAGSCLRSNDLNCFTLVPRRNSEEEKPVKYGVWLLGTPGLCDQGLDRAVACVCALAKTALALPGNLALLFENRI